VKNVTLGPWQELKLLNLSPCDSGAVPQPRYSRTEPSCQALYPQAHVYINIGYCHVLGYG
jgi:hypothetical protein